MSARTLRIRRSRRVSAAGCQSARQKRRALHRAWQKRDRASRTGKPLPKFD
jgi:hypothetical protein